MTRVLVGLSGEGAPGCEAAGTVCGGAAGLPQATRSSATVIEVIERKERDKLIGTSPLARNSQEHLLESVFALSTAAGKCRPLASAT
jgi:hypothetical protein